MDLSTITVADFRAQFRRDFPYLPVYDNTQIYNTGDITYYPPTNLFYQAIMDSVRGIPPLLLYDQRGIIYDAAGNLYDSNKKYWIKYMQDPDNYVADDDITKAFAEALISFNQGLIPGPPPPIDPNANIKLAFLYLTAHFLVNDLNTSMAGINSTGAFPMTARTVGSVSESYQVPTAFIDSPILAAYTTSRYGLKYLNMILPNMTGNMVAVWGGSRP